MNIYKMKIHEDYYNGIELLESLGLKNNATIQALAEKQKKELKRLAIERLEKVKQLIQNEELKELKEMISFSPAGDGYGCDNYFIDFGIEGDGGAVDINDVIELIEEFNAKIKKGGKR